MTCTNCGTEMAEDYKFCDNCGRAVAEPGFTVTEPGFIVVGGDRAGDGAAPEPVLIPEPAAARFPDPPPRIESLPLPRDPGAGPPDYARATFGAARVGQPQFHLAQDERILKKYEAVQLRPGLLRRKRGQGTLYVTDARLVFYAWVYKRGTQRESWIFQQTKLEDISGLSAYVNRRISLGLLVLSLAFGFAALASLFTLDVPLFLLFAVVAALCIGLLVWDASRRGTVGVTISSRDDGSSPINFGRGPRVGLADRVIRMLMFPILIFFPAYNAWDVVDGDPAEDADRLLHELGALILDLQTHGHLAYPHWGIMPAGELAAAVGGAGGAGAGGAGAGGVGLAGGAGGNGAGPR